MGTTAFGDLSTSFPRWTRRAIRSVRMRGRVVNYLTGVTPPPQGLDLLQVAALNKSVPSCAMRVSRATEMGPIESFAPPNSCGCAFDRVATG